VAPELAQKLKMRIEAGNALISTEVGFVHAQTTEPEMTAMVHADQYRTSS
jgi:hypothetical protein